MDCRHTSDDNTAIGMRNEGFQCSVDAVLPCSRRPHTRIGIEDVGRARQQIDGAGSGRGIGSEGLAPPPGHSAPSPPPSSSRCLRTHLPEVFSPGIGLHRCVCGVCAAAAAAAADAGVGAGVGAAAGAGVGAVVCGGSNARWQRCCL